MVWLARLAEIVMLAGPRYSCAKIAKLVGEWLARPPAADKSDYGLEALAWCRAAPKLAAVLPAEAWWSLLDRLRAIAQEAAAIPLEEEPLAAQILGGELPLTLAYLFPELRSCRVLAEDAHRALSAGLIELLDEGLPHGKHFAAFRRLFAAWTRAAAIGRQMGRRPWNEAAENLYRWLVRQAIALTRGDGSPILGPAERDGWPSDLFAAALALGGNDEDQAIARLSLPSAETAAPSPRASLAVGRGPF